MIPDASAYKVEVIYFINPHLIWIEVLDSTDRTNDYIFEQVGIRWLLPLETTLDTEEETVKFQKCSEWTAAANTIMKNILSESTEVWFSKCFIDRRSCIFDDNIHKYGDFYVKLKNGTFKRLSKLLKMANVGYTDADEFYAKLNSGQLKTKLDPRKTQEVVKEIENYYKRGNKKKTLWRSFIEKQTSAFQMGQGLEEDLSALTTSNLEKHNNKLLNKLIQDKIKDFELCKDIQENSVGRGYVKKNKQSYDAIVQQKDANQDLNEPNSSKTFDAIKAYLVANAKVKDEVTSPVLSKTSQGKLNKILKLKKRDRVSDINMPIDSKKCNEDEASSLEIEREYQFRQENIDDSPNYESKIKIASREKYNKMMKIRNRDRQPDIDMPMDDNKCNKNDVNASRIERESQRKQENASNNRVVFGPPGINPQHLKVYEINKSHQIPNEMTIVEKHSLIKNNTSGDDSELNFEINQQKDFRDFSDKVSDLSSPSKTEDRIDYNNEKPVIHETKSSVTQSESVKPGTKSLLLKKKLKAYNNLSANNSTFSSSDTSNKDTSSVSDKDIDENISSIVEVIDKKYKAVSKLKTYPEPNNSLYVTKLKNNVNPFKNIDQSISVFVDKLVSPVLMVHTKKNKRIQPVYEMRDVFFNSHIHIVLKNMSIDHPMMLQTISWNTILRGYSFYMISPPQSGKTLGYLPAVCRLISDANGNDSAGPVCIIVCATARSVTFVEEMAKMFLGLEDRVLACYAGVDDVHITSTLLNGCDLLISTPSSLIRLMQLNEYGVDLRRLSIFVFDDCERLVSTYMDEVKFFLFKIRETLKSRANNEVKVQYILASRVWCDFMEPLAKKSPDTVISIGAFQECILYSKSNTSVSFVKIENKLDTVFEFLKDIDGSKKTVIVCKSDDEVALLEKALKRSEHTIFSCNNEMTVHDLFNLSVSWAEYEAPLVGPILICCDGNLTHMNITDAHYLVHYSLPQLFSMFCKRFCVLNDNYPSIFKTDNANVKIKILLDGSNVEQLPKIMNFIKRCTDNIPNVLDDICDEISKGKEYVKAKNYIPLCDRLLIFGHCPDIFNCQERHAIFKEYDIPKNWMPKDGIITFKILHYHTATLYSARLLTNIVNGVTNKYPQTYSSLSIKMGMYYSKESNRRLHGIPKIGDICAVSIKLNFYARCQVVKILSLHQSGNPNTVLVNLIDEEKYEIAKDIYLYHLSDEFKDIETHVIRVRLANVKPKDKDITFSDLASDQLKKITDNDDLFIKGRVTLTLGNCVFVDTLEACQELTSLNETVVKRNLKKELLDKHAQPNPEQIYTIEKICNKSGLILKNEIKLTEAQNPVKNLPKGTWAYLEAGILSTVFLAATKSPNKFFVRLAKFESCMKSLLQDIKKYVSNYTFTEELNVKEGDLVLAECPEDSVYERARIDRITEDKTKCFFVDQGDWKEIPLKKIIPITEKFINQLPFQAIECRLIAIQPPGEDWSDFSNNWFIDNCSEDANGDLKYLYIKHFTKETAEFTNGYKYGVSLIDTNSDTDVVINQLMIDLNLARVNNEEKEYLNNLITSEESNKDLTQADDEDWEKISQVSQDSNLLVNTPHNKIIRSISLVDTSVDSDEDNFEKWDVNMDREALSTLLPGLKTTNINDNINEEQNVNMKQMITYCSKQTQDLDSDDLTSPENSLACIKTEKLTEDQKRRPKILWRQNKNIVTIKIQLIAVDNYDLEINDRTIKFSANVNDTQYEFQYELYGVVNKSECSHFKTGLYIMVKLVKVLKATWISLTKKYDTKNFISYDVENIDTSSEDEEIDKKTIKNIVETINDNETDSDDDEFFDDANFTYKKD